MPRRLTVVKGKTLILFWGGLYGTEESAFAHVRRLLDIVACTTAFGGSSNSELSPKRLHGCSYSLEGIRILRWRVSETGQDTKSNGEDKSTKTDVSISSDPSEKGDAAAETYPPPKLGQFYDIFSFSRLNPIHQEIRSSVSRR
ncbi:unnamed protein product [Lactuca saligna]|uniref:Uncharacterized protein n=1 Tax=Lactuca saligna TaxID=75948 RepID=A0AA36EJQ5_LACSI|nr:unnamed protein product [Lactuca saligna]